MQFTELASMNIESGPTGQERSFKLAWRPGGRMVKNANYQIKVETSCEDPNLRISLELWHGPDGSGGVQHSTPIAYANPGTPVAYLSGDADSTKVLSEYLMMVVKIKDNTTTARQWAQIRVYETRKPF